MTVDKPAKGGGRKPASGGAGRTMTDQELITAAAQAAVQAMMQMQTAAPVAQAETIKPADLENEGKADAEELREIKANEEQHKRQSARAAQLAAELIPLIVRPRHMDVFDWMKGNGTDADLLKQVMANVLAKALPAFREANGQISSSSTNRELLADSLPGRQ